MEPFNVERNGNQILVNREPETDEELQIFAGMLEDALVHAFMTDNLNVVYLPVAEEKNNDKNSR